MNSRAALVAAMMLTVAACGGADTAESTTAPTTSEPQTTTTTGPSISTRYESVFDMRLIAEDGGVLCQPWVVRGDDDYTIESAECTEDLVFGIYENASLIIEHRDLRNNILSSADEVPSNEAIYDLSGPNWNVACGDRRDLCEQLLPLLGGEITVFEPPDALLVDVHDAYCAGMGFGFVVTAGDEADRDLIEEVLDTCFDSDPPDTNALDAYCMGISTGMLIWDGDQDAATQQLEDCVTTIHTDDDQQALAATATELLALDFESFLESLEDLID